MLEITIPGSELWDSSRQEFIRTKETTIKLEHSLISVSKWESKWKKPFLTTKHTDRDELIDYVKCMTLTQNVPDKTYQALSEENISKVNSYIEDSKTATKFYGKSPNQSNSKDITSEYIYYQMFTLGIPKECEKWFLTRLLTLIRIFSIENGPKKNMTPDEVRRQNREINRKRIAAMKAKRH